MNVAKPTFRAVSIHIHLLPRAQNMLRECRFMDPMTPSALRRVHMQDSEAALVAAGFASDEVIAAGRGQQFIPFDREEHVDDLCAGVVCGEQ